MKKFTTYVFSGVVFGAFIGFVMAIIFSALNDSTQFMPSTPSFINHFSSNLQATVVALILWGAIGLVFSVSSLIFKIENWSITRQTVVHLIVTYVLFTPLAIMAGWFPLNKFWLVIYSIIFIFIYLFVWFGHTYVARQQVKNINQAIKQYQRK